MEVVKTVVIDLGPDQVYPAPEQGKVRVELSIRDLAGLMATHRRDGVLGAVLGQIVNSDLTYQVADQVVQYQWDTNEHPTLVQGTLDICWRVLNLWGHKLESFKVDGRLAAGKKLTTKLNELVESDELPGGLPCV